jgi:hypothetical protein
MNPIHCFDTRKCLFSLETTCALPLLEQQAKRLCEMCSNQFLAVAVDFGMNHTD